MPEQSEGQPESGEAQVSPAASQRKDEPKAATRVPIVGIGASAGGLEALERLTRNLAADSMAFIVLQHLAPGSESALTDILARGTSAKVVTAQDGHHIEHNTIYITPPSAEVALDRGTIRLSRILETGGSRRTIDNFFRSLAADQGAGAIGVLLSGAGSDGTLGLRAIKEEGGITFVQEPSTAAQPSMPQSALDAGFADFCLTPEEIAAELMQIGRHSYVAVTPPGRVFPDDIRSKIFALLRSSFDVDFSAYKPSTIERRIQRRMALHKLDRLEDYLRYVQSDPSELNVLYSDLLIGVTGFFRDREPFEVLKSTVFPHIIEHRNPEMPIRIWVAGCSTGEEAYSIAMCLLEFLGERAATYKIQIFATDIDDQALAKARQAIYPQSIETEVGSDRLRRFFSRVDKGYQVNRVVRDAVVFARHNLGKDPPFSRLDLVSCRNVLIYMQAQLQKKVLRVFHYSLTPEGFLLLGTSESVGDTSDLFTLQDRKVKLYTRKNIATVAAFDFALGTHISGSEEKAQPPEHRPPLSILQQADRKVLEKYGPPGVVINEKLEIIQFRGRMSRYLEPTPGIATLNVLKQVSAELLTELRPAIQRSFTENVPVVCRPVRMWRDKDLVTVVIDVTPLPDASSGQRSLLILFNEQAAPTEAEIAEGQERPIDPHVQDLERELATTKEYLQTTIEELEAANEELQSSNEELQSSNEELQSTNEELETSKEELQSTNEELVTLNEELQNRMVQLSISNDDLHNLLTNVGGAVLLVGMDLRIRRFSVAAERLLNLIPGDIGRPVAYVRTMMKARDIEQTVSDAINAIAIREQRVRGADGYWYTMRIVPYRTTEHAIRGAVIEFTRALPLAEEKHDDVARLATSLLASVPECYAVLDEHLRVAWANRAFLKLFDLGPDIFNRPLEDVWPGKSDEPAIWTLIEDAVVQGKAFRDVEIDSPFEHIEADRLRVSAVPLPREEDGKPLTALVLEPLGAVMEPSA